MGWGKRWWSLTLTSVVAACSCPETTPLGDAGDSGLPDVQTDAQADVSVDSSRTDAALPPWDGPHFLQVVTGSGHACARTDAGEVYCWGDDMGLQLGEGLVHRHTCGRRPCRPFAARVPVLEGAVQLAADGLSTCALRDDGSVHCTGQVPAPLPDLPAFVEIEMGAGLVCGVTAAADLVCIDLQTRERVVEADQVTDFAASGTHYCYIRESRVWCGGEPWYGELGETAGHPCYRTESRFGCPGGAWSDLPVEPVEVGTGPHITCIRSVDDEVYCWGVLDEPWTPPTHLPELDGPAQKLVFGRSRICVLRPSGRLDCREPEWDPTRPRVAPLPALGPLVSVELGHACAVTEDGAVSCWVSNGAGGRQPSAERVRFSPTSDWSPRPQPVPTEAGWVPYPTLLESCIIERAEQPESLGPFPVVPCGVSTCLRRESAAGTQFSVIRGSPGTPGLGGVVPFLSFTSTHRIYGLVSILTGEVLAAVRSPADPRASGELCIAHVAVGASQAVLMLRSEPFPNRIVYAPIESLGDVRAPTEIGLTNVYHEAVSVGAGAFTVSVGGFLEIHERGLTRMHLGISFDRIKISGSTVLWHGRDQPVLRGAVGLGDALTLLDLSNAAVVAVAAEPGRLAWIEEDQDSEQKELWTAAMSAELELTEPTSLGEVETRGLRIVIGDGQVAFIATNGDLVLRSITHGSERRLTPDVRWGELWYIADGHIVSGGQSSSIRRTPIHAVPLVLP